MSNYTYYYFSKPESSMNEIFWTCSRPIPGELIGWRNGMGFGVYRVPQERILEVKNLDAKIMQPISPEGWIKLVDRTLRKRSFGEFGLQNYYDMFADRDEAERVAAETLVDDVRLVTIEPA